MAKNLSLDELVAHFERLEVATPEIALEAARITAPLLAESIQTTIGDLNELVPLQPTTIERKASAGYPEPEAPLYATGELRASYSFAAVGNMATAGSDEQKSRWHEFGTIHVPPRPAARIGLEKVLPVARTIARGIVRSVMTKV